MPGSTRNRPCKRRAIWPGGHPGGHGLVAVGSHVGLANRQVAVARERGGIVEVELEVPAITGQKLGFQSSLVTAIPWVFALVGLLIFPGLADRTRRHTG